MAMNKKGMMIEMITFAIIGIIVILFFAGWIYGMRLVNTSLLSAPSTPIANITHATESTFSHLTVGYGYLEMIAFLIMVGFAIATLIVAYFSVEYPFMIAVYILTLPILIIFGVYISNAYQDILNNSFLNPTLIEFVSANVIMNHLPIWIGVIGFIGIIIIIVRLTKYQQAGSF